MKKAALPLWLATIALSPLASAQAPTPTPGAPGTPAAAAPAEPTLPNVEDPMLVPAPPAPHVLQSWREAIGLLRSRSTSLRTQLAQVEVARARSREAMSAYLPQLGTALGSTFVRYEILRNTINEPAPTLANPRATTPVTLPDPAVNWGAGLLLRIPVFAPKAWYDKGTADQNIDLQKLNTKEIERQVVASVADTIVTAVTAERLAEVSRVSLKSALSTLDLNKRRASLGASSALDVLRAEGDVQTSRALVISTDEGLIRAREALGLALGSPEGYGVTPDIHLDALADDARASCHAERDVAQRSDVRAATANLHVVERTKGSVDWAFWPTLDAVSTFAYSRAPFVTDLHFSWTVGANLNWVLYDGGLRYGQKDEALANERIAREQLTDVRRRAELQITQAFRAVNVAEANLGVSARAREIATETARLARVAFMNGSGTSFDLVDTASRLRQAELDLAVKQFEVLRARVAALLALASCDV
jgi:multidrug efflux system outer membrane protein